MNNKTLFISLAIAVFSTTTARLLSIREEHEDYSSESQLALTIERCPEARTWLARHNPDGVVSNRDYHDLADWAVVRENEQARVYLASNQPITCHALKDWRKPS